MTLVHNTDAVQSGSCYLVVVLKLVLQTIDEMILFEFCITNLFGWWNRYSICFKQFGNDCYRKLFVTVSVFCLLPANVSLSRATGNDPEAMTGYISSFSRPSKLMRGPYVILGVAPWSAKANDAQKTLSAAELLRIRSIFVNLVDRKLKGSNLLLIQIWIARRLLPHKSPPIPYRPNQPWRS